MPPDAVSTCPICGGDSRPYCEKTRRGGRWRIDRCSRCGHGFVVNRPTARQLVDVYSEPDHLTYMPWSEDQVLRRRELVALADRTCVLTAARGRSLDIGAGDGALSFHLQRRGFSPTMTDPDPRARRALEHVPGGIFYGCAFEDLTDVGPYDAVVMSHVLEHALDPGAWLVRARSLLSREGVLAIALPNFAGVYRLLGSRDPFLIPPVHLNYFTARSLARALVTAGLEPVQMRSCSPVFVESAGRRFAAATRLVARAWNAGSRLLDATTRGIALHAFARPAARETHAGHTPPGPQRGVESAS